VTNFGETPLFLAIEHQQHSAVNFAIQFNIQQLRAFQEQVKKDLKETGAVSQIKAKPPKRQRIDLFKSGIPKKTDEPYFELL
jgi:hypothetical protein